MEIENADWDSANLLKKPPKKKKERKIREISFYIARRPRKKKEPSAFSRWSGEVLKRNLTDYYDIKSAIREKYHESPTDIGLRILKLIGETKVFNGKVILSDHFANQPLYFYVNYLNHDIRVFSNDELYLAYLYQLMYISIKGDEKVDQVSKDLLEFMSDGILVKAFFTSKLFTLPPKGITSGYYQDYTGDAALIGAENLEKDQRNAFMNNCKEDLKFVYDGQGYVSYMYEAIPYVVAIIRQGLEKPKETIQKLFEQTISFNKKEGVQKGVKEIKTKTDKARYIDMSLSPESFCPSYTALTKTVKVTMVYKMRFDLNQLFSKLDTYYVLKKGLVFFKNSCYWDTMETWYDFLSIYVLTSKELSDEDKKLLSGFIDLYYEKKEKLLLWKNMQLFMQRILKEFYNCFTTSISYGKLEAIFEGLKQYYKDYDYLVADTESFAGVKSFLEKTSMYNEAMNLQMQDDNLQFGRRVAGVIQQFMLGKNLDTCVADFRVACQGIYKMSASAGNSYVFPIMAAQGAFFGDLGGREIIDDPIKEILNRIRVKEAVKKVDEKERANLLFDFKNNIGKYRVQVIENDILKLLNKKGEKLNANIVNALKFAVLTSILKNEADKEALDKAIADALVAAVKIDDVFAVPEKYIIDAYNSYLKDKTLKIIYGKINDYAKKAAELGQNVAPLYEILEQEGSPFAKAMKTSSLLPSSGSINLIGSEKTPEVYDASSSGVGDVSVTGAGGGKFLPMEGEVKAPIGGMVGGPPMSAMPTSTLSDKANPPLRKKTTERPITPARLDEMIKKSHEDKILKSKIIYKPGSSESKKFDKKLIKKGGGESAMRKLLNKGGTLDYEIEKLKDKEKMTDKLMKNLKLRRDLSESSDSSFIEKDFDNALTNRDSFVKSLSEFKSGNMFKGINIADNNNLRKIVGFYINLLQFMGSYVPEIKEGIRNVKGNLKKYLEVIGKSYPVSDLFIDKLSKYVPKMPNTKQLMDYFQKNVKSEGKKYLSFGSLSLKSPKDISIVVDLMNSERQFWPSYFEPEAAIEGLTEKEKKKLEKEVKEPAGYDITMEKGSNEYIAD